MCREEVASALNTGTKDSGASPNRVIVLCFYGKTLFPHGTSLHLGVNTGIAELLRPRDEFHGSPMSPKILYCGTSGPEYLTQPNLL